MMGIKSKMLAFYLRKKEMKHKSERKEKDEIRSNISNKMEKIKGELLAERKKQIKKRKKKETKE